MSEIVEAWKINRGRVYLLYSWVGRFVGWMAGWSVGISPIRSIWWLMQESVKLEIKCEIRFRECGNWFIFENKRWRPSRNFNNFNSLANNKKNDSRQMSVSRSESFRFLLTDGFQLNGHGNNADMMIQLICWCYCFKISLIS